MGTGTVLMRTLDGKDRVDPRHRLDGDRSLPQIGQFTAYLCGVRTCIADHPAKRLTGLLPWNWTPAQPTDHAD